MQGMCRSLVSAGRRLITGVGEGHFLVDFQSIFRAVLWVLSRAFEGSQTTRVFRFGCDFGFLFDVLQTTGVRVWIWWFGLVDLWRVCGVYTGLVSGCSGWFFGSGCVGEARGGRLAW